MVYKAQEPHTLPETKAKPDITAVKPASESSSPANANCSGLLRSKDFETYTSVAETIEVKNIAPSRIAMFQFCPNLAFNPIFLYVEQP